MYNSIMLLRLSCAGAATKESYVAHAASYIARFPPLSSGTFGNDALKCFVSLKGEGHLRGLTVELF